MTLEDLRDRPHWSFSALNQFCNCQLQYAFQRIYKLKPEFTSVSLVFGSAFHRTLEYVNTLRMEGQTTKADDAEALFADIFDRETKETFAEIRYDEDEGKDELSASGRGAVRCFVENIDPAEKVLDVNTVFCAPMVDRQGVTLDKPLIGELDGLVESGGVTYIEDYKTACARWPKTKAHKDYQATAFCYGYYKAHNVIPKFRFAIVVKNKKPVFEQHVTTRTVSDFNRLIELVKRAEAIIAGGTFMPNEGSYFCGNCSWNTACKQI